MFEYICICCSLGPCCSAVLCIPFHCIAARCRFLCPHLSADVISTQLPFEAIQTCSACSLLVARSSTAQPHTVWRKCPFGLFPSSMGFKTKKKPAMRNWFFLLLNVPRCPFCQWDLLNLASSANRFTFPAVALCSHCVLCRSRLSQAFPWIFQTKLHLGEIELTGAVFSRLHS